MEVSESGRGTGVPVSIVIREITHTIQGIMEGIKKKEFGILELSRPQQVHDFLEEYCSAVMVVRRELEDDVIEVLDEIDDVDYEINEMGKKSVFLVRCSE